MQDIYLVDFAAFDFEPVHCPGKQNVIADHLSRFPQPINICLAIITSSRYRPKEAQKADSYIKLILSKLQREPITKHLEQIRNSFKVSDGILLHISGNQGRVEEKIVVPQPLRSSVLKICHDDAGHLDYETTMKRVRAKYWWKSLRKDTKVYTSSCLVRAKTNRRTTLAYGLMGNRPIPETPWQIVSADHVVALPKTKAGNLHILVHIDHATRYLLAKPTCSLSAQDVIHTIKNDIIYCFGPPLTYILDMGTCSTSKKTKDFFNKYGIEDLPTTPYSPQSNGLVERANATLVATLTKMALDKLTDWDVLLPKVVLAIN